MYEHVCCISQRKYKDCIHTFTLFKQSWDNMPLYLFDFLLYTNITQRQAAQVDWILLVVHTAGMSVRKLTDD